MRQCQRRTPDRSDARQRITQARFAHSSECAKRSPSGRSHPVTKPTIDARVSNILTVCFSFRSVLCILPVSTPPHHQPTHRFADGYFRMVLNAPRVDTLGVIHFRTTSPWRRSPGWAGLHCLVGWSGLWPEFTRLSAQQCRRVNWAICFRPLQLHLRNGGSSSGSSPTSGSEYRR